MPEKPRYEKLVSLIHVYLKIKLNFYYSIIELILEKSLDLNHFHIEY